MATTVNSMKAAPEAQLVRYAQALETLAGNHVLTNLRLAGDGQLIADVDAGRTLLDIAHFEIEARAVLQATVAVISSRAPLAAQVDKGPLVASSAA